MSEEQYIDSSNLQFRAIEAKDYTLIKDFKCENTSLENFLRNDAYYYKISKQASTNLVFYNDELVGFFTLKRAELSVSVDVSDIISPFSLDIARIAVSKNYQERGIGSAILKKIIEIANIVNERFITLDALIERYDWYVKRGFSNFIEDEIESSNSDGLVYMYMDLFDESLLDAYFDEAI
ncbi:GNAT family N-acetyltransferase [Peribacillus butanolivorans]|uniref:GNAT family N-acetyltransferase n=1 Tax=Peribacillus butanolivorans TaxID=421767 RepID=UPI002E22448A|nr:GNAT family N-acetyltransferase [Peribacillus butanolivorans]